MPTGGFSPGPEQYGGYPGGAPLLQRVLESLQGAFGSAYDTSLSAPLGVELMAYARALTFDGYGANQRLANQFVPATMTALVDSNGVSHGLLPRWEAILGIVPSPTETETARRNAVAAKFLAIGNNATAQPIIDALTLALGPVFVGLVNITPSQALVYWPAGTTLAGYPWFSTLSHVLVETTIPSTYTLAEYLDAVTGIAPIMDLMLPAWADWQWFLENSSDTLGFILDDPHNLDFEIFDP